MQIKSNRGGSGIAYKWKERSSRADKLQLVFYFHDLRGRAINVVTSLLINDFAGDTGELNIPGITVWSGIYAGGLVDLYFFSMGQ